MAAGVVGKERAEGKKGKIRGKKGRINTPTLLLALTLPRRLLGLVEIQMGGTMKPVTPRPPSVSRAHFSQQTQPLCSLLGKPGGILAVPLQDF